MHIANPCHENWAKMTPAQHGRACASCNEVVFDMTRLSNDEILTLIKTTGAKCGRFYEDQLTAPAPAKGWLMQWLGRAKKNWMTVSILTLLEIAIAENAIAKDQCTEQMSPKRKLSPIDSGAVLPGSIQGRITDQNNKIDANRKVYLYTQAGKEAGTTTTDDHGFFTFALTDTLSEDKYYLKLKHVKEKSWAYVFHGYKTKILASKGEWVEVKTRYTKRERIFKDRRVVRMGYF